MPAYTHAPTLPAEWDYGARYTMPHDTWTTQHRPRDGARLHGTYGRRRRAFGQLPLPTDIPTAIDIGTLVNETGNAQKIEKSCYPVSAEAAQRGNVPYCLMQQQRYRRNLGIAAGAGLVVGALLVALIK